MTKDFRKSLDLGRLTGDERDYHDVVNSCVTGGGRPPPLLPEQFAERLEEKRFTNGKDDKPLVAGLYKQAFEEEFGKAEKLSYGGLGWGDGLLEQDFSHACLSVCPPTAGTHCDWLPAPCWHFQPLGLHWSVWNCTGQSKEPLRSVHCAPCTQRPGPGW